MPDDSWFQEYDEVNTHFYNGRSQVRFGVEHFLLPAIVTGCLYLCDIRSLAPLGSTLAPLGSTLAPLGQI